MFTVALHSADSWGVWCLFDFVLSFVFWFSFLGVILGLSWSGLDVFLVLLSVRIRDVYSM